MHILLIHQYFLEDHEAGGSRWNEISRVWVGQGHSVTVLAGSGHYMHLSRNGSKKFAEDRINVNGVRVIRSHVFQAERSGFLSRLFGYISFLFSSIWAGLFYAQERYDLVLVTSPPLFAGVTGIVLSALKRLPLVVEIRDLWPESAIETGVLKNRFLIKLSFLAEKIVYRRASLINVLTPAFKEILIGTKQVCAEKIILIPNAADFTISEKALADFDRDHFREQLGLTDKFIIIYVGAHGIANHLIQLLDAAEKLRGTNAFFLTIGDGLLKKELERNATDRNLDNVRFLPPVSKNEVFKYIAAADIGTSVLKKSNVFKTVYSNKTFDYFSCKKPVLIAIDGVSRQLVCDADAGLYAEPENTDDYCEKVRRFMNDPELVKRQGENGYHYAKKHFDREKLAKSYLNYLLQLTGK